MGGTMYMLKTTKNKNHMEKPKKPVEPNIFDKGRYPNREKSMQDMTPEEIENIPFIKDSKKYKKDKAKYDVDIELYTQLKFIKIIKVAKEKLILKKFKIIEL